MIPTNNQLKHTEAWRNIRAAQALPANRYDYIYEWLRLRDLWYSKIHRPYSNSIARRHAKGIGRGTGQKFLKTARIIPSVGLERVFIAHR